MRLLYLGSIAIWAGATVANPVKAAPNILKAMTAAAKVSCSEPWVNDANATPETQWKDSHAQDLWDALVYDYATTNNHKKYPSFSHYVAEMLGQDGGTWDCAKSSQDGTNGCIKYTSDCFYDPYYQDMVNADSAAASSMDEIGEVFVKYKKPAMDAAEILGWIAEFMSFGVGQFAAKGLEKGFASKLPSYEEATSGKASEVAQATKNKINAFKQNTNQMAFELSSIASEYIAEGKNLVGGAESIITECTKFSELAHNITQTWSSSINQYTDKLFSGKLTGDDSQGSGISEFTTLTNMVRDGMYTRRVDPGDVTSHAVDVLFSQLIPISLHQDDDSRPTLIDLKTAKTDTLFNELFYYPGSSKWNEAKITLKKYPKQCFFFVDANKSGSGIASGRFSSHIQRLTVLPGMTSTELNGHRMGDLTVEDFALSIHEQWLSDKEKNSNKKSYKITKDAKAGSPANLWESNVAAPGMYNAYFNECGSTDPKDIKGTDKQMDIVSTNMMKANDWKFADASKGFPCIPVKTYD
ncbi:uncharacterized protein N7511_003653 [Penicillium nucicola]|uniref:uncharacterized protein n=1 Tax=Penicillium nucicola TaxID=1850975 RepID=UPI002544DD1C|nr:uncharacterized protein N7511_003653 [Penicillium nucicola]KAJ5766037.1 hypothetical protein N7511_003653 [Penicillium nucicola]